MNDTQIYKRLTRQKNNILRGVRDSLTIDQKERQLIMNDICDIEDTINILDKRVNSEAQAEYHVPATELLVDNDAIIRQALNILTERMKRSETLTITSPSDTKNYLRLKLTQKEHEVFMVLFLDNRHQLITTEEMFRGTIDGASVYPREVVKAALKHNAAALILAHNHPSGIAEPSQADLRITTRLKKACELVDIRILDHIIVGSETTTSLAERGEI